MKNKLSDLNNHLFAQLERLGDEALAGDKLKEEISRSRAMSDIADKVVENGKLMLDAAVAVQNHQLSRNPLQLLSSPEAESEA